MKRYLSLCSIVLATTIASSLSLANQGLVYVSASIYEVMSPVSPYYFSNIQSTLKAAQSAGALISDINQLSFAGALVDGKQVTYFYSADAESTNEQSCRVEVSFKAIQGQAITNLIAKQKCHSLRED